MTTEKIAYDTQSNLNKIIKLVDKKCQELPQDIDKWKQMVIKHPEKSQTYKSMWRSSIEPRENYLSKLRDLKRSLIELNGMVIGKDTNNFDIFSIDMPVETLMRKYVLISESLRKSSQGSDGFINCYNQILDKITFLMQELNQPILRCSIGELNFKDAIHVIKVMKPSLEEKIQAVVVDKKVRLGEVNDVLIQRVEMDLSVRQSIQDRTVMHSALQNYLKQLETNENFEKLTPTIQLNIKQKIRAPLDTILSVQQKEADIANYELQQFLEPIQGNTNIRVPDSVVSVHQLLQQAISQNQEVSRLKLNIMGAFKHLVNQLDDLFQFQPITPLQSASVLGAAWMQNPLTTPEEMRQLKEELEDVKKSESYQRLKQLVNDDQLYQSFDYVEKKISKVADELEINKSIKAAVDKEKKSLPEDIEVGPKDWSNKKACPVLIRGKLMRRLEYLDSIKSYVEKLCDSVKGHIFHVYYNHSLNSKKVDLQSSVTSIMNQIVKEFTTRTDIDDKINREVLLSNVKNVINEVCFSETEKNMDLIAQKNKVRKLMKRLGQTKKSERNVIRRKIHAEKKIADQMFYDANIPRLKYYIRVLSKPEYQTVHSEAIQELPALQNKLKTMLQYKITL